MGNDLQDRVFPIFHYALVPGGMLVLGSSETIARHEQLFQPLHPVAADFCPPGWSK